MFLVSLFLVFVNATVIIFVVVVAVAVVVGVLLIVNRGSRCCSRFFLVADGAAVAAKL